MSVAQGGVRQQHLGLSFHPGRQTLGPSLVQNLLRSPGKVTRESRRPARRQKGRLLPPRQSFVPVDGDVAEIAQQLGGPVAAHGKAEQFRRIVNEGRVAAAADELFMAHHIGQEGDVGFHPADAELFQAALHLADGRLPRQGPGGHFHQ